MATPVVGVKFRPEKPSRDDRRGDRRVQSGQQQHRGGGGGGGIQPLPHHDGTFERFISSALVAIITIFFSWRVLTWTNSRQNDPTDGRRTPGGKSTSPTVVGRGETKADGGPKSGSEVGYNDDNLDLPECGGEGEGEGEERDGLASCDSWDCPPEGGGPDGRRAARCAGAPATAAQHRYSEEASSGNAGELAADDNRYPAHGEKRFKADTDRSNTIDIFDAKYRNKTESIIVYKYEDLPAFVQPASSFDPYGPSLADRHACFVYDDDTRSSCVNTSAAFTAIDKVGQILKSDVSEDYLAGQELSQAETIVNDLIYSSSTSVPVAVADSIQRSFLYYPAVTAATHQSSIFEIGGSDQRASSTMSFTSALPSATLFPPKMDQYQLVPMPTEEEMTTWDDTLEQTEENVDEDGRLSRTGFHEMGPWDPIDYDDGSALQGYFDHEYFDSSEDSEDSEFLCERRLETILEEDEERESEDDDTDMEVSDSEEEEEEEEAEEAEDEEEVVDGNMEEEDEEEEEEEEMGDDWEVDEEAADGPGKLVKHKLEAANSEKVTSLDDLCFDDESLLDENAKSRQHESNVHPVMHQSQYSHQADTHAADLHMKLPKTGEIKKYAPTRSRIESHKVLNEVKDIFSALVQSNCNSHSGDTRWSYFDKGDGEDSHIDTTDTAKRMSSSVREHPYVVDFNSNDQDLDLEETSQFRHLGTGELATSRIDRERNVDTYDVKDDTFSKTTSQGISELSPKSSVITDGVGNHFCRRHENDGFPGIIGSATRREVDSEDASPGNKEHSSIWISKVSVTPTTETVTCRTLCDDMDGSNKDRNSREENANESAGIHNKSVFSVNSKRRPDSVNSPLESFFYDRKLDDNKIGQNNRGESEELKFPRSIDSMHATTSNNNFSSFRTPKPNTEPVKSQISKNRTNSPCPTRKHFSVIDINIDDDPLTAPSPKTDIEELKQRLANVRLKAPPKPFPDKMWNADELLAKFRSREKDINRIGHDDLKRPFDYDTTDYAMKRAKSLSTLPKSAQISVSPGFSDARNFSEAASEANSPQANGCDEKYLKTQSLSDLSNNQKFSVYNSDALNKKDDRVLSQSERRLFESLQQLSVPAWFQNSPRKHQEIVILKNARSIENILADVPKLPVSKQRQAEKATSSSMSKPVVIAHHVSLPVYKKHDETQKLKPSVKQFELPSARHRTRSATPFQPIKILTFEEIMRHKKELQITADEQSQNVATKGSADEHSIPSTETEFIEESMSYNTGDKTSLSTDPNGVSGRDIPDHINAENMHTADYEQHSRCSEDMPIAKSSEEHNRCSEDVPIAKSRCSEDMPIAKSSEAHSRCSEDMPIAKSSETSRRIVPDETIQCIEPIRRRSITRDNSHEEKYPYSVTEMHLARRDSLKKSSPLLSHGVSVSVSRPDIKKPVSDSTEVLVTSTSSTLNSTARVLDIAMGKEEELLDVARPEKKAKKLAKSGIPGEKRRKQKFVTSDDRQDLNGEDVEIFKEEISKEVIVLNEKALVPEEDDDAKQAKRKIRKKKSVRRAEDTEGEAVISVTESAVDESLLSNTTIEIEQERTGKLKTRRKKDCDISLLPEVNGPSSQLRQKMQQPDVPTEVQLSLDDARLNDVHLKSVELLYPVEGTPSYDSLEKPSKAKKSKRTKKSTNESELGEFLVSHDDSKQYLVPDTNETEVRKSSKKVKSKLLNNLDENRIGDSLNVTSKPEADQSMSQELTTTWTDDGLIRPKKLKKKTKLTSNVAKTENSDFVEPEQNEPTSFNNGSTHVASKKKSRLNKVDDQMLVADVVTEASDKNLSEYSICSDQTQNKIVDISQDSHSIKRLKKKKKTAKSTERSFTMETDLDAVESMQSDSGIAGSQLQLEVQNRPPSDERRIPKTRRNLHVEEEDTYTRQGISPALNHSQKISKIKQEEEIMESSSSLKLKKKAKLKSKDIISSTENVNGIDNSYSSSSAMLGSRDGNSDINCLGSSSNSFVETAAKTRSKARKKRHLADEVADFSPSTSFSAPQESSLAESGETLPSAWHKKSHTLGRESNKTRTSANSPRLSKHRSNPGLTDQLVRFEYQF